MIAVIFEARPRDDRREDYFRLAAELAAALAAQDGFLSVERFESLSEPGKLLSLSFWRDEAAVTRCRRHPPHRQAQIVGATEIFADYRLRVAQVIRDYGPEDRAQAPAAAAIPAPPGA